MRRSRFVFVIAVGVISLLIGCDSDVEEAGQGGSQGGKVSYKQLAGRLVDMEGLAELPLRGGSCGQFSSYDRASRYDAENDKYIEWDSNADGEGYLRREGERFVLAEMSGPGCIWRIWSAMPEQGRVSIYIDGSAEAAVEMAFEDYFSGAVSPFDRDMLVYTAAMGQNCYVPIPYQKSCKIVADEGWGRYYHFTYSSFGQGMEVQSFSLPLSVEQEAALDEVNEVLRSGTEGEVNLAGEYVLEWDGILGSGEVSKIFDIGGAGAIRGISAELEPGKRADWKDLLSELVLKVKWDGGEDCAVYCPLGAFFGTMPGLNSYRSYPMGITDDGLFYSRWYMPFGDGAVMEVVNQGGSDVGGVFMVYYDKLCQEAAGQGRFHAKWHGNMFLPENKERAIDWTILKTRGRGRYVGTALHVWNPKGDWWGEGDEKFFVDGESFPSTFGTGSEDYFGYAWCRHELFSRPFHNQTLCEGVNQGHISVNRWHIADNIPFQESFAGYIEKYFSDDRPTTYDCVAYWYLAGGGEDPYGAVKTRRVKPVRAANGVYNQDSLPMESGCFAGSVEFGMLSETEGARIYYTLDGSEPSAELAEYNKAVRVYDGPVKIDEETVVKMRGYKNGFEPGVVSSIRLVPCDYLESVEGEFDRRGVAYEVYRGQWRDVPDFEGMVAVESGIRADINAEFMRGEDLFGLYFRGMLKVSQKGVYKFTVASDDGAKLWVDGELVVDNGGWHSRFVKSGTVALESGFHLLEVGYIEYVVDESLEVYIEGPSMERMRVDERIVYLEE